MKKTLGNLFACLPGILSPTGIFLPLRLQNVSQPVLINSGDSVKRKNDFFQITPDSYFSLYFSGHIFYKYIGYAAFIGPVNVDKNLVSDKKCFIFSDGLTKEFSVLQREWI